MFERKCPECWNWFINFFDPSLADTSLESLFKYMIILLVAVIILYGIFSMIAYASSAAANFARKVTAPVASLVLVIFMLIVVSQLRSGKTCRFEEERYLTQCIPKVERNYTEEREPKSAKKSTGKNSWDTGSETSSNSASKNSWDSSPKESTAPRNSWDGISPSNAKSKTVTKTIQSDKTESPDVEDCTSKKNAKKPECSDKEKERDYSEK